MYQSNNRCGCPSEWITNTGEQKTWTEQYDFEYDDFIDCRSCYEDTQKNPRMQKNNCSHYVHNNRKNCNSKRRNSCLCFLGVLNCFRCW